MKRWLILGLVILTAPAWIALLLAVLVALLVSYPIVRLFAKGPHHDR